MHIYFNIMEPLLYSNSKFKVLIIFIHITTRMISSLNESTYTSTIYVSMNRVRSVFFAYESFFVYCECLIIKPVNFLE